MNKEAVMEDRLSALPDSLLVLILSLLEIRETVRTSVLSKHWEKLWTTVPCLEFIETKEYAVGALIDQVLQRWSGTKILTLKIDLSSSADASSASSGQMDLWLRFAAEKKVDSLDVRMPFDRVTPLNNPLGYRLPECVYSCSSSITKLLLVGFSLDPLPVGGNLQVQWFKLETLYLEGLNFSEDAINQVVSCAPKLKKLTLMLRSSADNLNIRSSSLKIMFLLKYNLMSSTVYDPSMYTKLTIWAPKLEVLQIIGNAYIKCLLMDVSSLTQAGLYFSEVWEVPLRDTFMQILPKIQHVEALALSPCSFEILGVMLEGKYSFSAFSNVKELKFCGGLIKPNELVGVAELFPKVELLHINFELGAWLFPGNLSEINNVDDEAIKNLESFWMQLKRVEFIWHSYKDSSVSSPIFAYVMFKLIDFLLEHALMVQEIVIRNGGSSNMAAERQFRELCSQKIIPTKRLSITFIDSEITIKRRF